MIIDIVRYNYMILLFAVYFFNLFIIPFFFFFKYFALSAFYGSFYLLCWFIHYSSCYFSGHFRIYEIHFQLIIIYLQVIL